MRERLSEMLWVPKLLKPRFAFGDYPSEPWRKHFEAISRVLDGNERGTNTGVLTSGHKSKAEIIGTSLDGAYVPDGDMLS